MDKDLAAFKNRRWNAAMLRFLRVKRGQGRDIAWIAAKLGVSLTRAMGQVVNLRLTRCGVASLPRGHATAADLAPLGAERTLPDEGHCRWIAGDTAGPWRACARPTAKDTAWCPHHEARVYVKRFITAGKQKNIVTFNKQTMKN